MVDSVAELLARFNERLRYASDEGTRARIMLALEVVTDIIEEDGCTIQDYINQLDTRG
jgi:hypothetical protein